VAQLGTFENALDGQSSWARLSDRGIDPDLEIGQPGQPPVTVLDLYVALQGVAATEKAGQAPTHALARLALSAGLPAEVGETLFLAYNQQSAEEAGHGDKIFGGAYFAMGGAAPDPGASAVATGPSSFLEPTDDRKSNKKVLGSVAAALGGIEMVALSDVFPNLLAMCERWNHPIARELAQQIEQTVRPEEARHVLTWRYVFHRLIAPKGEPVIDAFFGATNSGRISLGYPALPRTTLERMTGNAAPTFKQLLGRECSFARR
jgi:hypothetical protein